MAKNLTSTSRSTKSKKLKNDDQHAAVRKAACRLAWATYRDKYVSKGNILLVSEVGVQTSRGTCEQGTVADEEVRRRESGDMPR
jgi:hypothetical protein